MNPIVHLPDNIRWYTQLGWAVHGELQQKGMQFTCYRVLSVNPDNTPHLELEEAGTPWVSLVGTIGQNLRSSWRGQWDLDTVEEMMLTGNMMAMCALWTKEVYGQQGSNLVIEHRGAFNGRA